jgi:prepilin-type N-terminal cleavage/methylation domain-containing protein
VRRSSKKGFTLIEMLLAIAITLIISGLFVSLIVAIRSSYYRTYNDVDCADIAAMYAEALENAVLSDIQNGVTTDKIYINDSGILTNDAGTITFDSIENFNRADGGESGRKWDIRMVCLFNSTTGEFRYKFFFIDKYVNENYLHYVYEGSFWIPSYAPFRQQTVGMGDEVPNGGLNTWDYNYTSPVYNFTIDVENPGVDDGSGSLTSAGLDPTQYHVRYYSDGMGELRTDTSATDLVSVPLASSIIKIDPVSSTPT